MTLGKRCCSVLPVLVLPVVLYLALALPRLGTTSLWLDELMSLEFATEPSVTMVLERLRTDRHAPVYFLLTHGATRLLGTSEFSGRIGAVVCGAFTILLLGGLTHALRWQWRARLAAGLVLAASPYFLEYSREVRPYSAGALFVVLSWWAFVRLLRRPRALDAFVYGVALAGVALSFYLGMLCVVGQFGVLLAVRAGRRRWLAVGAGAMLGALLGSVWLPSLLAQLKTSSAGGRPLGSIENMFPHGIGVGDVLTLGVDIVAGPAARTRFPALAFAVAVSMALLTMVGHLRQIRGRQREGLARAVTLSGFLLPFAAFLALCLVQPIPLSRYLVPQASMAALFFCSGVPAFCSWRGMRMGLLGLVVTLEVLAGLHYHATMPRTDWRGVAQRLGAEMGLRDLVVTDNVTARSCLAFSLHLAGRPELSDNVFDHALFTSATPPGWLPEPDQRVWVLERPEALPAMPQGVLARTGTEETSGYAGGLVLHKLEKIESRD